MKEYWVAGTGKLTRTLIEGVVIVASILLAFGVDAWWDERQERVEETEILAGLHREFEEYWTVLLARIDQHAQMLSAMAAVLESIEGGAWISGEWDLDAAVGRALSPPTTALGNGVRDALVQAGRLDVLSDATLRERLAGWPAYQEEMFDDEVFGRDLVFSQLLPFLTERGLNLSDMLRSGVMPPGSEWPVRVASVGTDASAADSLLSEEILTLIAAS